MTENERIITIKEKRIAVDILAIGCLAAGVCQRYPECDGQTEIEAGDVICAKCGQYQECGDTIIRRTCRVI